MWLKNRNKFVLLVFLAVLMIVGNLFFRQGNCQAAVSVQEWKKSPTGSAGVLEGKAVLVSIYIDDQTSRWTTKSKSEAQKKVNSATAYIAKQAKSYGKSVEFIADTTQYQDIGYRCRVDMKIKDSIKSQTSLYRKVRKYMNASIDVTALREKYGTDSIGFLFHVNKSGVSSTLVHYMEDGTKYFYECSTLFSKYEKKPEGASTYAHEILHLFGARDLYGKSLPDGITTSFVKYIRRKFPNEIMYSTYTLRGRMLKYKITNDIGRVTAYYLGWKDSIPELKKYSLLKVKQKGCFSDGT